MERSSYIREYAQIHGINLLMNVIERLKSLEKNLMEIVVNWQETRTLGLVNQVQLIFGTSGDDLTSQYLVYRISLLNEHLMSEFPHKEYALKLTQKCLNAMYRAIQSHSHIWNEVQVKSILASLGSAYVIRTKGLPYIDNIDEEKEDNVKKKKEKPYVLDYKRWQNKSLNLSQK